MAAWLVDLLREHALLALFLTLALGYLLGKLKIGDFTLGEVTGVLIVAIVIGQLDIKLSRDLQNAFFLLFLFAVGYRTGPQFFRGLKMSGVPQVALTLALCGTGLGAVYAASRLFSFDVGAAAGLLAGALTESAAIGTASEAIDRLRADEVAKRLWMSHAAVTFAVTYFVGTIATIVMLAKIAPKLMRVDLAAECARLEREMGLIPVEEGVASAYRDVVIRTYRIPPAFAGRTIAELEGAFAPLRVFVERVRASGLMPPKPDLVLNEGDRIALQGRHESLLSPSNPLREFEIEDRELQDIPVATLDVLVTDRGALGRTIGDFRRSAATRGVFLHRITRAGNELPLTETTQIDRGDMLAIVGGKHNVDLVAARAGYAVRSSSATDVAPLMAAMFIGGVIGVPALSVGSMDLQLTQNVGVLLGGIVFGWLRSIDPRLGHVPDAAVWIFESLGLTAFLAAIGLAAGPDFLHGLKLFGGGIVVAAIVCVVVPIVVTLAIGRLAMKMHPGILLGLCAGAITSAPALLAVQEAARSRVPALGYGVSNALGHLVLTLFGAVIVAMMTA